MHAYIDDTHITLHIIILFYHKMYQGLQMQNTIIGYFFYRYNEMMCHSLLMALAMQSKEILYTHNIANYLLLRKLLRLRCRQLWHRQ